LRVYAFLIFVYLFDFFIFLRTVFLEIQVDSQREAAMILVFVYRTWLREGV